MKKHWIWMVLGCGIPLLFVFIAPSLGIGEGVSLLVFIVAMLVIHLFMPMDHRNHSKENKDIKQK